MRWLDSITDLIDMNLCKLWRRQWHPTPVLLPGKLHGWRSLVGYSPWGHKESDTTEQLYFPSYTFRVPELLFPFAHTYSQLFVGGCLCH